MSPAAEVREVTATELRERTASVLREVERGGFAVVSRHGAAVAMVVPLAPDPDGGLRPVRLGPERAAGLDLLAEELRRRRLERRMSELLHGRWYGGGGIHGPYARRRRRG